MRNLSEKDTVHEYISTKEHEHATLFRVGNYFVLMSLRVFDLATGLHFPDGVYYIVVSAVVGYDIKYAADIVNSWRSKKR